MGSIPHSRFSVAVQFSGKKETPDSGNFQRLNSPVPSQTSRRSDIGQEQTPEKKSKFEAALEAARKSLKRAAMQVVNGMILTGMGGISPYSPLLRPDDTQSQKTSEKGGGRLSEKNI